MLQLVTKKGPNEGPFLIFRMLFLNFRIGCYTSAATTNDWCRVVISVSDGNGIGLVVNGANTRESHLTKSKVYSLSRDVDSATVYSCCCCSADNIEHVVNE